MNFLGKRLAIELSHFHALGENLGRLWLSYAVLLMATPMLRIFINTYFWRQDSGVLLIVLYNFGWVLGLPVGFYINGLLLRKVHVKYLYFLGVLLQGVGAALAIFSGVVSVSAVAVYGLMYGVTSGLFWGNKNALDFSLSRGRNRGYLNHMNYFVSLMLDVIMPVLIGWFIVSGENLHWYSIDAAYKILMALSLVLLGASGLLVAFSRIPTIKAKQMFIRRPSRNWQFVRLFHLIFQMMMGLSFFLPGLIILYFGSKEGVVGTLMSLAAVLSAGTLYIFGRKARIKDATRVFVITNVLMLLGALFLFWQFSWLGAVVYLAISVIMNPLRFSSSYTVIMEIMDEQDGVVDGLTDYAHVFDNEIFFNIARTIAVLLFLGLMYFSTLESAIKWAPLIIAAMQFAAVKPLKYLMAQVLGKK